MYLRISLIVLTFLFCWPRLAVASESYPRLANYFLKWEMTETEAKELARWDLLILDMENQENNPVNNSRDLISLLPPASGLSLLYGVW